MAKYFKPAEVVGLQEELVKRLDWAREKAGVPFVLTSGYREGDPRAHGRGWAVDIRCRHSRTRYRMVAALIEVGFRRIGVYDRHIHADLDETLPDLVMWWGKSE